MTRFDPSYHPPSPVHAPPALSYTLSCPSFHVTHTHSNPSYPVHPPATCLSSSSMHHHVTMLRTSSCHFYLPHPVSICLYTLPQTHTHSHHAPQKHMHLLTFLGGDLQDLCVFSRGEVLEVGAINIWKRAEGQHHMEHKYLNI